MWGWGSQASQAVGVAVRCGLGEVLAGVCCSRVRGRWEERTVVVGVEVRWWGPRRPAGRCMGVQWGESVARARAA